MSGLKKLTEQFRKTDKAVDDTTDELKKFENTLREEGNAVKNTTAAQLAYVRQLQKVAQGLDKNSAKYKLINKQLQTFQYRTRSASSGVENLAGALASIGVGVSFGLLLREIKGVGVEFGKAEGAVKTLAKESFPEVSEEIKKVVAASKGLTNEVEANEAAYQLLSAGVSDAAGIQTMLAASVKLAKAGFTDTTTAVDGLTTVVNAYGKSTQEATRLADQFAQTQNDGKITIGEYAANIGKVAPVASALGVSLEEVNAAIARSTAAGSQAEVATTGLRAALTKLAAPTKEQEKILKKYNLEINAATLRNDKLLGTLLKLQNVTSDEDLLKIVGTEAGTTIQQLLGDIPKLTQLIANQKEAAGTLDESIKQLSGSYADLLQRTQNELKDLGAQAFKDIEPALIATLKGIRELIAFIKALPAPVRQAALGVGALATALLAIVTAVTGAALVFNTISAAIVTLTGAATASAGAMALLGGAIAALPWVAAAAGVAALTVALVNHTRKQNEYKDLVENGAGSTAKLISTQKELEQQINKTTDKLKGINGEKKATGREAMRLKMKLAELKGELEALKGTYKIRLRLEQEGYTFDELGNPETYADAQGRVYSVKDGRMIKGIEEAAEAETKKAEEVADLETKLDDKVKDYSAKNADALAKQRQRLDQTIFDNKMRLLNMERDAEMKVIDEIAKQRGLSLNATGRQTFNIIDNYRKQWANANKEVEKMQQEIQKNQMQLQAARETAARSGSSAVSGGGRYIEGGYGPSGPNAYGAHFDIKRSDGSYFGRADLDKYVSVNGKPLSSGVTVPGGEFGAMRDGGSRVHNAWDYAFGGGAALTLKNGAKFTSSKNTAYGDATAFQTPDGKVYRIIHGKFEPSSTKESTALNIGGAADMTSQIQAAGSVEQLTEQLRANNEETANRIKLNEQLKAQQIKTMVMQLTAAIKDEATVINEETEALVLRNRLQMEGVDDALIEAEIKKLKIRNDEQAAIAAVNEGMELLIRQGMDAATVAGLQTEAIDALKKAYGGLATSVDNAAKAQMSTGGNKIANQIKQWNEELNDTEGQIISLANTVQSELATAMSDSIVGLIENTKTAQEAFSEMFKNIGKAFISMASQMIAKALVMKALGILQSAFGGAPAGGIGAGAFAIGKASFEGGGYTGDGPRAGGLDGRGGYLAMVHPNETVIDHQSAMSRYSGPNSSGGGMRTIRFESTVINNVEYVTTEQAMEMSRQAADDGAKRGAAGGHTRSMSVLKNSRSQRSRLGLR